MVPRRRANVKNRSRRAFTLIELIIVIVVLGILATIAIVGYKAVIDRTNQSSAVTTAQAFSRELNTLASNGDSINNNPNDTDPRKPYLFLEMVVKGDVPDQYTVTTGLTNNQVRVLYFNQAGAGATKWTRLFCAGTTSAAVGNTPCPTVSSSLTSASLISSSASPYAGTWAAGHLQNPTRATGPANTPNPAPICLQFHKGGQDAYLNVSQFANTPGVVSTDISVACPSATYGGSVASTPTAVTSGSGYHDLSTTATAGAVAADPTW